MSPGARFAAVGLTVVSAAGFLIMPVMVGAAVADLGLDDAEVGWLSSGIMGGSAVAAVLASLSVQRGSWRQLCFTALSVQVVGQLVSTQLEFGPLLWAFMLVASMGAGATYSFALAVIGEGDGSGRLFGFSVAAQVAFQMLGMLLLPWFAVDGGFAWVLVLLASLGVLGFGLTLMLPERRWPVQKERIRAPIRWQAWLALGGCFFFFANIGAFWAYVERIGAAAGMSPEVLGNVLAVSVAAGLAGALMASWQGRRLGHLFPLALAAIITVASLLVVHDSASVPWFLVGFAAYNFAWNYSLAYQYDVVAHADVDGRLVALSPAFHGIGAAVSPIVVALLITSGGLIVVNVLAGVAVLLSLAAFVPLTKE